MTEVEQGRALSPGFGLLLTSAALAGALGYISGVALNPFLVAIARDLGKNVRYGQVPALSLGLAAVLGLTAGPLADRFGHRRLLLLGFVALVVNMAVTAIAATYATLVLATAIGSISQAILAPVALAIVGERFPMEQRRRAIGIVIAGAGNPDCRSPFADNYRGAVRLAGGLRSRRDARARRHLDRVSDHSTGRGPTTRHLASPRHIVGLPPTRAPSADVRADGLLWDAWHRRVAESRLSGSVSGRARGTQHPVRRLGLHGDRRRIFYWAASPRPATAVAGPYASNRP